MWLSWSNLLFVLSFCFQHSLKQFWTLLIFHQPFNKRKSFLYYSLFMLHSLSGPWLVQDRSVYIRENSFFFLFFTKSDFLSVYDWFSNRLDKQVYYVGSIDSFTCCTIYLCWLYCYCCSYCYGRYDVLPFYYDASIVICYCIFLNHN